MPKEFVVFNAEGREVDWVDPYLSHDQLTLPIYRVDNGLGEYAIVIPRGGRFEVRDKQEDEND